MTLSIGRIVRAPNLGDPTLAGLALPGIGPQKRKRPFVRACLAHAPTSPFLLLPLDRSGRLPGSLRGAESSLRFPGVLSLLYMALRGVRTSPPPSPTASAG